MRVCKHGCDVLDSRCLKKYPNRSHKDKFFCADTYSVGIIFNRNSVKSTAAPFFFLYGCFALSRCTRLEKWKRKCRWIKGPFIFGRVYFRCRENISCVSFRIVSHARVSFSGVNCFSVCLSAKHPLLSIRYRRKVWLQATCCVWLKVEKSPELSAWKGMRKFIDQ